VEEGIPLMRAANTGISAGFDPRGHELARLGLGRTGFLPVRLPSALPAPLYARAGLWLPGGASMLFIIVGLAFSKSPRRPECPNFCIV
jgi:apolipoprotein N-acyltransferase